MLKNYMTTGTFAWGKKPEGDPTGKATATFPEEMAVMSIYGGHCHTPKFQILECD
jgi:hypothetical protein